MKSMLDNHGFKALPDWNKHHHPCQYTLNLTPCSSVDAYDLPIFVALAFTLLLIQVTGPFRGCAEKLDSVLVRCFLFVIHPMRSFYPIKLKIKRARLECIGIYFLV